MTRSPQRPGRWIAIVAVALAAAVLWTGFGLHYAVRSEIVALLDRVGANVFHTYRAAGEHLNEEDRERVAALPEVALAAGEGSSVTGYVPGSPHALTYFEVSPEYLNLMRLRFALGEGFATGEKVAVLGAEVARVLYPDADPVGTELEGLRIVGVLEPIPADDSVRERLNRRVLVPLGAAPVVVYGGGRRVGYFALWIRPSGSIDAAIRAVGDALPGATAVRLSHRYAWAFAMEERANRFLLFATGGLFLLAGTIVAGTLSLASLAGRRGLGVRRAVGARRADIARLTMLDALRLSAGAGLLGILLATAAFPIASRLGLPLRFGPLHAAVLPLLVLLGALAAGLPAWKSTRLSPVDALAARDPSAQTGRKLDRGLLIVAASAAIGAFGLYVFCVLGSTTLRNLDTVWGDIDERTLLVSAPAESILYPPDITAADRDLLEAIDELELVVLSGKAGIRSVSGIDRLGLTLAGVGPGYEDLGLFHFLKGRDLTGEEIASGAKVVILSAGLSMEVFGDESAIGETIRLDHKVFRVVGVYTGAMALHTTGAWMVAPYSCLELWPGSDLDASFWVRVEKGCDPALATTEIVEAFRNRYPGKADVSVLSPHAEMAPIRDNLAGIAFRLALLIGAALLLAAASTFNLVRFHMALRERELGIRRAIGAAEGGITGLGTRWGLRVGLLAATIGLIAGVLGVRPLAQLLHMEVTSLSPIHLAIAGLATIGIASAAGAWAGWLASRPTPATSLRRGRR